MTKSIVGIRECPQEPSCVEKARAAVERLANVQMNISLEEWGELSSAILAGIGGEDGAVREAAKDIIASRSSTYKARNGRVMGIQDEAGEMMWVVPFDEMTALEAALALKATLPQATPKYFSTSEAHMFDPESEPSRLFVSHRLDKRGRE